MIRRLALLVSAVVLIPACIFSSSRRPEIEGHVQNPQTPWAPSPAPGEGGPRRQYYNVGGTSSHYETGAPEEGKPTGLIAFGPRPGGAAGAANSTATAEFECGSGVGGRCFVKFVVGSGSSGAFAPHEFIRVSLQGASGGPTRTHEVAGNATTVPFELELPTCGKVRVTLTFRETVNAQNPAGIQTSFTVQISEYGCRT